MIGGLGVISVVANVVPGDMAGMTRAFFQGKFDRARELHYKMLGLMGAMFLETNPIPVKTALHLMGKCEETFRLPLCPMAKATRESLKTAMASYDLI